MGFFSVKTVPFYIASTFLDFQLERNVLRDEVVFPLNQKYRDELLNVKSIDLRWGILPSDSEAEHEEKVLNVCTEQIKRTNSNVILFLGDRYGWVPSDKKIAPYLKDLNLPPLKTISITALEIIYALHCQNQDSNIFIYMRNIVNEDELDETTRKIFNEENQDLKILKEYLFANYPKLIRTYDVRWDKAANQIVKPENLKSWLFDDIENTLRESQTQNRGIELIEQHLRKTLNHYVERKFLENDVLRKLRDTSRRGVLISNSYCDGTSTMIAAAVRALQKTEKSVFYYSEDMKLDRASNIKELLEKPYLIRKPKDNADANKYFLDYMYIMNLFEPIELELFLEINPDYERVVILLRKAIKEFIQSKKYRHFICEDNKTTKLQFLSSLGNIQFLTSRAIEGVNQHMILTKSFQKNEAITLLKNLARDSSKEISEDLIQILIAKETKPKLRMASDFDVAMEFLNNANKYPSVRPAYEEPEWVKKAFHLLEAQTDYGLIEEYAKSLSGKIEDLNKHYIDLLKVNLGKDYTKFAISYFGFFKGKMSLQCIKALLSFTLPNEATELKFAELQNLLKDFCDFDEDGIRFRNDKTKDLFFTFMRENVMHSQSLPYIISFYKSQSPERFLLTDWLYFEENLAKLLVEELSIDLSAQKQLEHVGMYKQLLEKHVGLTDTNISTYEKVIDSLKGQWGHSDYQWMRGYLTLPSHMKQQFKHEYFNLVGEEVLKAFDAYIFINDTIVTDGKHRPLYDPKNEKKMKEYEFFKRLLSYRYKVHKFIDD